jgi:glycosyltransferase involved in cell wall biosynthesis
MRALVVSHEWEALTPGGAQRSAGALARSLAEVAGVEVTLASAVQESPDRAPTAAPVSNGSLTEVLVASRTSGHSFSWTDPSNADAWRRLLEQVQPDVVHLHHYYQVGVELPLLIRRVLPQAAIVMTLHEFLAICLQSGQMLDGRGHLCMRSAPTACAECVGWPVERTFAREDYVRRALAEVDAFVTPSHFAQARYVDWGLPEADVSVIPNVLELSGRQSRLPRRLDQPGLRLAFVGQHTPFKGLDVLVSAVESVERTDPGALASVDVYGAGSERFGESFHDRIMERLADAAPLIRTRGAYQQDDLADILDGVDAIVVPSTWWENSPVVIEEALGRRVPVICSDIGGMAEKVRDGVDGWHFPAGNASSLARLIVDLSRRGSLALPDMRRPAETGEVVRRHMAVYGAAIDAARLRSSILPGRHAVGVEDPVAHME